MREVEEKEWSHMDPLSLGHQKHQQEMGNRKNVLVVCLGCLQLCESPDTQAEEGKTSF